MLIEIRDLVKDYQLGEQAVRALHGVNLNIGRNEYVAIMGPSGSGKSTLMNLIGCLDTPTSGSYILNGQDVGKLSDDELATIRNREYFRGSVSRRRHSSGLTARISIGRPPGP